ncbi:MAG: hypothetical protein M3R46_10755 [Actinomycetota bacterium]|nr:hypothetical protein [Actinomycetota bacterium]
MTLARLGPTEFGALNVRTRLTPAGQAIVHVSARVRSRAAAPFSDSHPVRDGVA